MKRLFELLKTLIHGGDERTARERYLAQSVDAQDLEVRLQAAEREHPDSVIDSHVEDVADSTYVPAPRQH